jgi:predicted nucleic acid-binding protein
MRVVLDASCILVLALDEEMPQTVVRMFDRLPDYGAAVPSIWRYEVVNVLLLSVRRQRIDIESFHARLAEFARLSIAVDEMSTGRAWNEGATIAQRHGLTIYDAAYLELAIRLALPLATLDKALARAARSEGVEVIGD